MNVEETIYSEKGEDQRVTVQKIIYPELEDKVNMIPARIDAVPYSVYVTNQNAGRIVRKDILAIIRKNFAEFFDGRDS